MENEHNKLVHVKMHQTSHQMVVHPQPQPQGDDANTQI